MLVWAKFEIDPAIDLAGSFGPKCKEKWNVGQLVVYAMSYLRHTVWQMEEFAEVKWKWG